MSIKEVSAVKRYSFANTHGDFLPAKEEKEAEGRTQNRKGGVRRK